MQWEISDNNVLLFVNPFVARRLGISYRTAMHSHSNWHSSCKLCTASLADYAGA